MRNAYKILVGKPEGTRPIGRRGREDNIKMDIREIGLEVVDWIHVSQDGAPWRSLVNTIMNLLPYLNASFSLASSVRCCSKCGEEATEK
jgi:hypothetical protein